MNLFCKSMAKLILSRSLSDIETQSSYHGSIIVYAEWNGDILRVRPEESVIESPAVASGILTTTTTKKNFKRIWLQILAFLQEL